VPKPTRKILSQCRVIIQCRQISIFKCIFGKQYNVIFLVENSNHKISWAFIIDNKINVIPWLYQHYKFMVMVFFFTEKRETISYKVYIIIYGLGPWEVSLPSYIFGEIPFRLYFYVLLQSVRTCLDQFKNDLNRISLPIFHMIES